MLSRPLMAEGEVTALAAVAMRCPAVPATRMAEAGAAMAGLGVAGATVMGAGATVMAAGDAVTATAGVADTAGAGVADGVGVAGALVGAGPIMAMGMDGVILTTATTVIPITLLPILMITRATDTTRILTSTRQA